MRLDRATLRYTVATLGCVYLSLFLTTNFAFSLLATSQSQTNLKTVENGFALPNQPVVILNPKSEGHTIRFDQPFEGSNDWLKNATFKIRNVSRREIVFLQLDLNFPETTASGPEMSFPFSLGLHPDRNAVPDAAAFSLAAGEEADVTLDEKAYKNLVGFIESRQAITTISKTVVRVGFVIFSDGLGYSGSYYQRRDPDNPKRWNPIKTERGQPVTPP